MGRDSVADCLKGAQVAQRAGGQNVVEFANGGGEGGHVGDEDLSSVGRQDGGSDGDDFGGVVHPDHGGRGKIMEQHPRKRTDTHLQQKLINTQRFLYIGHTPSSRK